jgi:glycosyltransferase involved in cell wall biosynthesis
MSMQTPVIATNIGGPSEIITDGQDGILIEPNKPAQLAETILQMLDNPDRRQKIGNAARKTIEERYDNKKIVKQVERIYETILKKNS